MHRLLSCFALLAFCLLFARPGLQAAKNARPEDALPQPKDAKYNPSGLPLKETAVVPFKATILLPEGMQQTAANEYSVTYTLNYPDGLAGATLHIAKQPIYFPSLDAAVDMASSFTGGAIKDKQQMEDGSYVIVKEPDQLGQQEIWYFTKGSAGYLSASCLAEAGYEAYYRKVVCSLKPDPVDAK